MASRKNLGRCMVPASVCQRHAGVAADLPPSHVPYLARQSAMQNGSDRKIQKVRASAALWRQGDISPSAHIARPCRLPRQDARPKARARRPRRGAQQSCKPPETVRQSGRGGVCPRTGHVFFRQGMGYSATRRGGTCRHCHNESAWRQFDSSVPILPRILPASPTCTRRGPDRAARYNRQRRSKADDEKNIGGTICLSPLHHSVADACQKTHQDDVVIGLHHFVD